MDLIGIDFREKAIAAYREQLKEYEEAAAERRAKSIAFISKMLESQGIDPTTAQYTGQGAAVIGGITIEHSLYKDSDQIYTQCSACHKIYARNLYTADSILKLAGELYTEMDRHIKRECPQVPPLTVTNYQYATGLIHSIQTEWIKEGDGITIHTQHALIYSILALVDAIDNSQPKY